MKKAFYNRLATVLLAGALAVAACGCNGNSGGNNNGGSGSKKDDGGSSSSESKVSYYVPESTVGANGKDYKDYDPYSTAKDYKGKTVKFATWIDHTGTEGGKPIQSFYDKYGIKVELVYCSQDNYAAEVLALIASGNSPDVYVENGNFPTLLNIAQDFSVTGVDLNEPIWSQKYINACTINNKVYAVNTVNTPWASGYITVYNRELMEINGIKTPAEYIDENNWTWASLKECAKQVDALGANYKGIFYETNCMLASVGATSIKYDSKTSKFINNTSDPMLSKALQFLAEMRSEGMVGTQNAFVDGLVGFSIKPDYGLKKTGFYRNMDSMDLGVAPMPAFDSNTPAKPSAQLRGYGIVRGAKNPKAAGLFIRYYLDPANYDLSEAFISDEAVKYYYENLKFMNESSEDINFYFFGPNELVGSAYGALQGDDINSPAQVSTTLASLKNRVQNAVDKANETIAGK